MCPQAEGRVEMPYRKETCPADIIRVPESGVRCAGCIIEKDLGTASGDRFATRRSVADRNRLWAPPVSEGGLPRPLLPPSRALRKLAAHPPALEIDFCLFGTRWQASFRRDATPTYKR